MKKHVKNNKMLLTLCREYLFCLFFEKSLYFIHRRIAEKSVSYMFTFFVTD